MSFRSFFSVKKMEKGGKMRSQRRRQQVLTSDSDSASRQMRLEKDTYSKYVLSPWFFIEDRLNGGKRAPRNARSCVLKKDADSKRYISFAP